MHVNSKYFLLVFYLILCSFTCRTIQFAVPDYSTISPLNGDSSVNMIVEIPAGTTAKYEMHKSSGRIIIDSIDGKPRYIDYVGYPGNYGLIPNTILPKDKGGDGDPLDVLLLGPSLERASIHKVRIVGVLELKDNGEQDDKLIAVPLHSNWDRISNIGDLNAYYPGVKLIVETFFENYKGKNQMKIIRWKDEIKALEILNASMIK